MKFLTFSIGLYAWLSTEVVAQQSEIYGRIIGVHGEPIANARVDVLSQGLLNGSAITDFDGQYSIGPFLASWRYTLVVSHLGYKLAGADSIWLRPDEAARFDFLIRENISPGHRRPLATNKQPKLIKPLSVIRLEPYPQPMFKPTVFKDYELPILFKLPFFFTPQSRKRNIFKRR